MGPTTSGLDLLASAALSPKLPSTALGVSPSPPSLVNHGPYNPITMVSSRVAKKIMDLEFIEMAEIVAEDDNPTGRPTGSSRPPITNISQWLERFSVKAAILSMRYPGKAPEFLAYQASIGWRGTMRVTSGSSTTASSEGRHWLERTSTGRSRTAAYIMRHSRGEPGSSLGAHTA